jgi:hypothetical protein
METKSGELRCPRCLRRDIVPSQPRGILDDIMSGMGRIPRHCRSCGKRFYVDQARCHPPSGTGEDGELTA